MPVEVVKRRFRDDILGEAAEAIVNKVVFDELEGRGLKPLAPPKVEEVKLEEGQPMTLQGGVRDAAPHRAARLEGPSRQP